MRGKVWGYKLTSGHHLPIYELPYSLAELRVLFNSHSTYGPTIYSWSSSFPASTLVPQPDLDFWRYLLRERQQGHHQLKTLAALPSGNVSPLRGGQPADELVFHITHGVTQSNSSAPFSWSSTTSTGSTTPHNGGGSDFVDGSWERWFSPQPQYGGFDISPMISPGVAGRSRATVDTSWIHCLTSDQQQVTLSFAIMDRGGDTGDIVWGRLYLSPVVGGTIDHGVWFLRRGIDFDPDWDRVLLKEFGEGDITMPRFDPTAVPNVGVYIVRQDQLLGIFDDIWTRNFWEAFQQVFGGDPSSALLSIRYYYGLSQTLAEHYSNAAVPVTIGNTVVGVEAGVRVPHLTYNIVDYSCGIASVPRKFGDDRDYTHCGYRVWVPFVGWVDLDPEDILPSSQLCLTYRLNAATGEALAILSVNDNVVENGYSDAFWVQACSMGVDIPYAINSSQSLGSVAVSMLSLGAISGNSFTPGEGSYTGSTGNGIGHAVVTDLEPKLVVYQKDDLTGSGHVALSGRPSAATVNVGDLSGYFEIEHATNASYALATRRMGEIIDLLRAGVYA